MYKNLMLARIALWVIGAVDVVVFTWQAVTERQQHPHFFQERLDHQVLVVGASALLLAQIAAVGVAVNGRASASSGVRNAVTAVVLSGAAFFNAASLFVLGLQVPFQGRKVAFRITGLSLEGDFVVPCSSRSECAGILVANRFELPPELSAAH